MNKKIIFIAIAIVLAFGLGYILFGQIFPPEYAPSDDEIALHIYLDTEEDIGLLVFDYRADDFESTGGISNADKSMMKCKTDIIQTWDKRDFHSDSDSVELSLRMRVITEYVDPNFENVYPDELTKLIESVSWEAHFGETYYITIRGDKASGYEAVFNR